MTDRHPPGPGLSWFPLRAARNMRTRTLPYLCELARAYPDIVYLRFGHLRSYFVFHPDLVREVLVAKAKRFARSGRQVDVLRQWDGNGLALSDGDFWLRQRRLVQPAFSPRRLAAYGQAMVAAARRLAERLKDRPEVEISQTMTDLTLEIIARTMFDVDVSQEARRLGEAVEVLSRTAKREMESPFTLPLWLPTAHNRRKRWAMRYLDDTVRRIIRERRASGTDRGDLLSMLLLAVDEEGDGRGMTDEQARDEAMTLLLAGHDTTAATLNWVWFELCRHPEVEARVVEELESELHGRPPTAEDVPRLRYLDRVIKETLRRYPPAWVLFARVARDEVEVGGYRIPKGGLVYPATYMTHHDPRWFPEPERFDPGRFAPGRVEQIPPFAYYPFGAGPRVCIGMAFATTEMVLVLATLLQRFRAALVPGQPSEVEIEATMSLRPKGGIRLVFTSRAPAELTGVTA
jgi:cytochrome P450